MKRIDVFRAGTHRAADGTEAAYTDAMLRLTAAAYDPDIYKAPICIGHPTMDAPAYGWVQGLEFANGILGAWVDEVEPAFAQAVREGRYRNVSASFWRPDAPSNPKAGILSLRHVGFLGAVPPAVKGLKTASFADEGGVLDFAGSGTVEALDEAQAQAAASADHAARAGRRRATRSAPTAADLVAREAALDKSEMAAFCDRLEREGRLLPSLRSIAETLLLSASPAETVTFAEKDGGATLAQRAALMRLMELTPKAVHFGEVAPIATDDAGAGGGFAPPAGYRMAPERADLLARAERLMTQHGLSFAEAVRRAEAGA